MANVTIKGIPDDLYAELKARPKSTTAASTARCLSNIGTLFAFALVSGGVLILQYKQPERIRGFRVPGGPVIPVLSMLFCLLLMAGLPITNWIRFFVWLIIGLFIYFFYGRHHSEFGDKARNN